MEQIDTMKPHKDPATGDLLACFDVNRTHMFDKKTKRLVGKNPYRLFVIDGEKFFEWPVGSGNCWYKNKRFAGRVATNAKGDRCIDKKAKYKEWTPPLTEDQKLAKEVSTIKQENERLQAELAAIKKEQAAATKQAPTSGASKAR